MAGTTTLYFLVRGKEEDAIKQPAVLKGMENVQNFISAQPYVGKTVSIVDFLKQKNRGMSLGNLESFTLLDSRELIG